MPSIGKEAKKGGAPQWGKSAPRREEAGTSHQGKGAERRKEVEESRGERSGMHGQTTRSAVRMEKKLDGRAKEKSGGAL